MSRRINLNQQHKLVNDRNIEQSASLTEIAKPTDLGVFQSHNSVTLAVNAINAGTITLSPTTQTKRIHLFGRCVLSSANHQFDIMGSNDNVNYFRLQALQAHLDSVSGKYHFSFNHKKLTRYIRIQNPNSSTITEFTLNYNEINK